MPDSVRIDTPESVDLLLEPAGLGSRFLAALVDALVQFGTLFLLFIMATFLVSDVFETGFRFLTVGLAVLAAVLLLLAGLVLFVYKLALEALWNGQTIGKRAAGIRVVRSNGLPVTFVQVLLRNLMRTVDFLPWFYFAGSVAILTTRRSQRLGDLVAGTMVVRERAASAPVVPGQLEHVPLADLVVLGEHARRLPEAELNPARLFMERRSQLDPAARQRVAHLIAQGLAGAMRWPHPLAGEPEHFIAEVLYARARG